jgi:hypothetical protein
MLIKRIIQLMLVAFILPLGIFAQVTTSNISGTVTQANGEALVGASISVKHIPTGTRYAGLSKNGGVFTIPGMQSGGPYTLTCEFVGFKKVELTGINLALGGDFILEVVMESVSAALSNVTVTATRTVSVKTGVATNVGQKQITTLPSISRSLTDFTRLTPQANGNSFAGRDGRYNNVTVDGANLNNNFGLSTDPLPGGGNQPISLDAVEEVSVNIAPNDVRQSNFTGANIAAVTKSGTNTFKGSAYSFFRDQKFIGRDVGNKTLAPFNAQKTQINGITIGGPIIKNKLFFFVSGELEKRTTPYGSTWVPTGGSGNGNVSAVHADSLRKFSNYLASAHGYQTGAFDNFPNFQAENYKILAKLNWNINLTHKLSVKYNELKSDNDVMLNATSTPNSPHSGGPNVWTPVARNGVQAMSFVNSNYKFTDIVKSGAVELNSNWKGKFSNQMIATYTYIRTTRTPNSTLFPMIDIIGPTPYSAGGRNNYMSAGLEPFSLNNDVKNEIYNITNNFNYYAGKHTITVGGAYEYQFVGNMFMPGSQSYYTYGSLADFMNPAARPVSFSLTYSRIPGKDAVYSAAMKIGQMSFYAQDEFTINSNLKLTYGVRFDKPTYPEQPLENPSISALTFPGKDGKPTNYSTGMWPKATFYAAPRASLKWDLDGNKKTIINIGTGVYTGRIPFVYLTNMPTNSGMFQVGAVANAAQLAQITFNKDPKAWQSLFTAPAPTPNTGGFVLIDKNYKFPQVWRTNVGFEKKLNNNWAFSTDVLYSLDLNATVMRNANETTPTGVVNLGGSTRPSFPTTSTAGRRVYAAYANAIVLENNKGGGSFSFTSQITKSFTKGFYASLAYTFSEALDITANPGSTAISTWGNNPTSGTQNTRQLSASSFVTPHRIVGTFSYKKEYLKHLATTFSVFYEGAIQGRYSYIYGAAGGTAPSGFSNTADINYDGNSQDLMYIPRNASEITFTPLTVGSVTYTAQQQSDAFFKFVAQDKYLRRNMGNVAARNGAQFPMYHRVDARILQDIFTNIGSRKNTLQLSFDCTNFLNILNKNWGIRNFVPNFNPLRATKNATTGEVRYQLATYTPTGTTTPILMDRTFVANFGTSSTWSAQIGLRYIF